MADKATILQNAQRYMAKGQIDKAIEEWQKLISETPNDGNIYNTIGDLLLKKNDLLRAVEAYLKGAEVFHAAGFALKTIAIYKKLIKLVPQRLDILIKLGDLNAERGLTGNAVEDYLSAAKQYAQDGFVREALEVYRKIANLDPSNTAVRLKLAEMCLKEGLQKEAIDEFLKIAESFQQNNRGQEAQTLYQRILEIDPKNAAVRKLTGEPEPPPAPPSKEELLSRVEASIEKGRYDEAQDVLRRVIELDPDDPMGPSKMGMVLLKAGRNDEAFESLKTAAQKYLDRSEYGQAGKLMKDYLEADPGRVEAHQLLAEAYDRGGNPHLAVSAYAHAIDEYLASGVTSPARDLYSKIKALDPQHRDVRRLRHTFELQEASQPRIVMPDPARPLETAAPSPPLSEPPPVPSVSEAAHSPVEPSPVEPPAVEPPPIVDPTVLQSLFTEAEVYLKYGLSGKAIEQLEQVLAMDPDNETAHGQLKDIYKMEGQIDKAVEACFHLMEIYKKAGDTERRSAVLEEARGLDPENPRIREATDLAPILESGRMEAILAEESAESAPSAPSPETERAEPAAAPPGPPQVEISVGSIKQAADSVKEDLAEQIAEADFYYQEGLRDEAKKMYDLILTLQPDHEAARKKLAAITAEEAHEQEMKAKQSEPISISKPVSQSQSKPMEKAPAAPASGKKKPAEAGLTDEQQLDEELEKSFASFMNDDASASVEASEAAGQAKASSGELTDISGALDEKVKEEDKEPALPRVLSDEETLSEELDSIFSKFQKDVKQQAGDTDYETHYNLGIAYKEMGLLNEAVLEFNEAMKAPARFADAASMLAACERERGNHQEAVALLERALSDSRCNEAQGRWLRYDLASIYEKEERLDEALSLFNDVLRDDPHFKDTARRVENLQALLGKSRRTTPKAKAAEEDKEVDAMMESIFGEASSATQAPSGSAGLPHGAKSDVKKKDRISYL